MAWKIDDAINEKSGTIAIDDPEVDEDEGSGQEASVIEILSDDSVESGNEEPAPKKGVVTKAYRLQPPLSQDVPKRSRISAATEALSSITSVFNPSAMKARDEAVRMQDNHILVQSMQSTQFASVQVELRETRARIDVLHDRLNAETRRADRAESQLEMYKVLNGGSLAQGARHSGHRTRDRLAWDDRDGYQYDLPYSQSPQAARRPKRDVDENEDPFSRNPSHLSRTDNIGSQAQTRHSSASFHDLKNDSTSDQGSTMPLAPNLDTLASIASSFSRSPLPASPSTGPSRPHSLTSPTWN